MLFFTGALIPRNYLKKCWIMTSPASQSGRQMILVVAIDGIWEMANPKGDMLGKAAVLDVIRKNAREDSSTIMDSILDTANAFREDGKLEDDMTIIVAKGV